MKKRKQIARTNNSEINALDIGVDESLVHNFHLVKASTDEFSNDAKLGEGGSGDVFRGKLDGNDIAVKRLVRNSSQGDLPFKNEISLLAKLQHRNLVRLLGFSNEGTECLVIYEFLPNGSLDKYIYNSSRRETLDPLDREKHYNILTGVAKGLLYLHEDSRQNVIHHDLKASNVLLDEDMNAKISDFGLAKLCNHGETRGYTIQAGGTLGYMAPEITSDGRYSVKSDVYSYGVLVLEMIAGRKNLHQQDGAFLENLPSLAWKSWKNGIMTHLIDPSLRTESCPLDDIRRIIKIGLTCVQKDDVQRPTMRSVVQKLNSSLLTLPAPSEPLSVILSSG